MMSQLDTLEERLDEINEKVDSILAILKDEDIEDVPPFVPPPVPPVVVPPGPPAAGGIPIVIPVPGQKVFVGLTPPEYSYSVLPSVVPKVSGKINLVGQLTWTPDPPVLFEAVFSRSIGDFTKTPGRYFASGFPDGFSMRFIIAPYYKPAVGRSPAVDIHDEATATAHGYAWTPASEGQWYMNLRWSPSVCTNKRDGKCAMALEYFLEEY